MYSKYLTLAIVLLGCVASSYCQSATGTNAAVSSEAIAEADRNARQALEGATATLQNNLINALSSMANASAIAGRNVSRAAATMIRGLVTNTFSLAQVVAYMPRLLLLDGPTQFMETLRLIRSNQIRLPSDMDSAIDTLLVFAGQVRDSNIGENFSPLVTFFPNVFTGLGDFMTTLVESAFTFIGPV